MSLKSLVVNPPNINNGLDSVKFKKMNMKNSSKFCL